MIDPPLLPGEAERLEAYARKVTCPECRRGGRAHWPYCSKAPEDERRRWHDREALRRVRSAERLR